MPFRGGGLPGVNLSEQGNAGWKSGLCPLLEQQKKTLQQWSYKKGRCTCLILIYKRPTATDHVKLTGKQFRAQQEREAEELVNILDDEYVIILEAVQSENPEYHLPKAAEKHRPKRKQQKDDARKKSKKIIKMITQQHLQHQNHLQYNQKHQALNKNLQWQVMLSVDM